MNPLIQLKKTTPPLLITLALLGFGLLPRAQAVNPPPDGGYPGLNTAEGQKALFQLTSGTGNTAVGWFSLESGTAGNYNTGLGAATLVLNTADENTATGTAALFLNTTGFQNTANGAFALLHNTEGNDNTATGFQALFNNTTGSNNTSVGVNALGSNTTGSGNTAIGNLALIFNPTGGSNTAIGAGALFSNTIGNNNTALGTGAGSSQNGGSDNIYIGNGVSGVAGENSTIRIGDNLAGGSGDVACFIGGIDNQQITNGIPVLINSSGQLGTSVSSQRFKEEIKPMERASEALFSLKPVTFHYKKKIDPAATSQFGLVAEDVEKVNPDLVVRDREGKPYSVRYEEVNAMLLNEFLKEHRKVQELTKDFQATAAQLTARLDEQAAQIQKVSAQLEASKAARQVVNNQ